MKAPPPLINSNAPTLTREGYFTMPPLKRLQRMTDDELAAVDRFVVRSLSLKTSRASAELADKTAGERMVLSIAHYLSDC